MEHEDGHGTDATDAADETAADPEGEADEEGEADADAPGDVLPDAVAEEAERLTRLAREAVDDNESTAYRERRADLLAEHGYVARVRSDDTGDTLVMHPAEWLDEDGHVRLDRVDDVDRGVERPLSGPGDADDWASVEAHNRAVAARVEREHGPVHGANAHAFADFMGNHYAKPVERATPGEREEFLADYFPRNAWPTDAQRDAVERSLALVEEVASCEE
jgi:hypothetical protein